MSCVTIYKFQKDGTAVEYASIANSWLGAMAIWRELEEKYLPLFRPDWVTCCNWYRPDMSDEELIKRNGFRPSRLSTLNPKDAQEVWDLVSNESVSAIDRICLYTTFDKVILRKEYFSTVIYAFENFEGTTNLREQAQILRELLADEDCVGVAWCQNSVSDSYWQARMDDDFNEIPYNLTNDASVYYMFEGEELPELLGIEVRNG